MWINIRALSNLIIILRMNIYNDGIDDVHERCNRRLLTTHCLYIVAPARLCIVVGFLSILNDASCV